MISVYDLAMRCARLAGSPGICFARCFSGPIYQRHQLYDPHSPAWNARRIESAAGFHEASACVRARPRNIRAQLGIRPPTPTLRADEGAGAFLCAGLYSATQNKIASRGHCSWRPGCCGAWTKARARGESSCDLVLKPVDYSAHVGSRSNPDERRAFYDEKIRLRPVVFPPTIRTAIQIPHAARVSESNCPMTTSENSRQLRALFGGASKRRTRSSRRSSPHNTPPQKENLWKPD